jgi:hypothetical protein
MSVPYSCGRDCWVVDEDEEEEVQRERWLPASAFGNMEVELKIEMRTIR